MSEGRVWRCSWKKEADGTYRAWVTSRPRVMAKAGAFDAADEALWLRIIREFGDGENLRDYDPPAPARGAQLPLVKDAGVVHIAPNAVAHLHTDPRDLFETFCDFCRAPRGARNSKPLVVECFDTVAEGAFTAALPYPSPPHLHIVSEKFLAALTQSERCLFEWRRVTAATGRPRKKYYEAIPKAFVPTVRVKGVFDEPLITCDRCGRPRSMALLSSDLGVWQFICAADLPGRPQGLFAVGAPDHYDLCTTIRRWTVLRRTPAGRGWLPQNLGVVSPEHVDRHPAQKLLSVRRKEEGETRNR